MSPYVVGWFSSVYTYGNIMTLWVYCAWHLINSSKEKPIPLPVREVILLPLSVCLSVWLSTGLHEITNGSAKCYRMMDRINSVLRVLIEHICSELFGFSTVIEVLVEFRQQSYSCWYQKLICIFLLNCICHCFGPLCYHMFISYVRNPRTPAEKSNKCLSFHSNESSIRGEMKPSQSLLINS